LVSYCFGAFDLCLEFDMSSDDIPEPFCNECGDEGIIYFDGGSPMNCPYCGDVDID